MSGRLLFAACMFVLTAAAQFQTKVFDSSNQSSITALRAGASGDLVIAGIANRPGVPLVNAYQSRFGSSGMLRTRDSGRTWQTGQLPPSGPAKLAADPADANMVYALTSTGLYRSADGAETWQLVSSHVFGDLLIAPQSPSILYADTQTEVFSSDDRGATWRPLNFPESPGIFALALDPYHPGHLYAGTGTALYRTVNGGGQWTTVALPSGNTGPALLVFDPGTMGVAYLRDALAGAWYCTRDSMTTWKKLSLSPPYLTIDPSHSGVLYAYDAGRVIRSEDFGATWTTLTSVAGNGPINIIPGSPPTLIYLYTISYDGGATWSRLESPFLSSGAVAYSLASPGTAYAVTEPRSDTFLARLDRNGEQIRFSTLLGGSGLDDAYAVAIDGAGNEYVAGRTTSPDFPTTSGAAQTQPETGLPNGFISKFDAEGHLLWSTFTPHDVISIAADRDSSVVFASIGAVYRLSANGGRIGTIQTSDRYLRAVAITRDGNIAVAGLSQFPYYGYATVVVTFLDPFGKILSETQLGSGAVTALETDESGNAVLAGVTNTSEFPTTPGAVQASMPGACPTPPYYVAPGRPTVTAAFVARVAPGGGLISSTLLGGQCFDSASALAIAPNGDALVMGSAGSPAFPVVNPLEAGPPLRGSKGFVARVSPDATALRYSTFTDTPAAALVAPASGPPVYGYVGTLGFISLAEPAPIAVTAVGNDFHYNNAAVAPGEIAFISTIGLDDVPAADLGFNGTPLPELNGVRVYFGDRQAELISILPSRIACRVPPELPATGSVPVRVERNGLASNPILVHLVPSDPGLLAADGSGHGQANARNDDGTLNTPDNPARAGSIIRLYFTGIDPDPSLLDVRASGTPLRIVSASPVHGFAAGLSEVFVQVNAAGDQAVTLNGSPQLTISVR